MQDAKNYFWAVVAGLAMSAPFIVEIIKSL